MTQYIKFNVNDTPLINWSDMPNEEQSQYINTLKTNIFTLTPPTVLPELNYEAVLDHYLSMPTKPIKKTVSHFLDKILKYKDTYDK